MTMKNNQKEVFSMTNLFVEIGKKIQAYLDAKHIKQTELAQQLGLSKQVMNKIIQGKKAINVEEIAKISSVLEVTVDELIRLEEPRLDQDAVFMLMGTIENQQTKEEIRFLNYVMDEMIELEELLQK